MKSAVAIVWAFLLLLLLPITTQYRLPPGGVNETWYLCFAGSIGLGAYGGYCLRTEKGSGRLLHFVTLAVAIGILCCLLLTYREFAIETHYRMGGS